VVATSSQGTEKRGSVNGETDGSRVEEGYQPGGVPQGNGCGKAETSGWKRTCSSTSTYWVAEPQNLIPLDPCTSSHAPLCAQCTRETIIAWLFQGEDFDGRTHSARLRSRSFP
jgi:hypothetical protein